MAGAANPQNTAQPSVYNQSSQAYNAALGGTGAIAAGQGPNIGQFFNPFTQAVTNTTLRNLGSAQQQAMNQIGQQASAAGAFGGSRHGVAEAQTNEAFVQQAADTLANLNQQGFNTALGAAQQQQQTQLGALGQLANLSQQGFNYGQAIGQQQAAQGTQQQAINQALIDAARAQYSGFTGAPSQSLQLPLAALGAVPTAGTTTTSGGSPGLLGYLTAGASLLGSPWGGSTLGAALF